MSRVEAVEQALQAWAAARTRAGADTGGDLHDAIASLPLPLRAAVEECYLVPGDLAAHAARLGCPPWTLNRRLSRVHRLLHGTLLERRERRRDADLVAALKRRLSADDGPGR